MLIGVVVLGVIALGVAWIVTSGFLVTWAWNILIVPIAGLPPIDFWQAVAVLVLAHLIVGQVVRARDSHAD